MVILLLISDHFFKEKEIEKEIENSKSLIIYKKDINELFDDILVIIADIILNKIKYLIEKILNLNIYEQIGLTIFISINTIIIYVNLDEITFLYQIGLTFIIRILLQIKNKFSF